MKISVRFSESAQSFTAKMESTNRFFETDFGRIQAVTETVGGDPYQGEYIITPKMEAQTLPTKKKVLFEDVTVKEIPVFRVSNTSGGTTVYIANEV
jgi:hypothetical protein